jgi:hypothetical protein
MCIPAAAALAAPEHLQLRWRSLRRDVVFFVLSVALLLWQGGRGGKHVVALQVAFERQTLKPVFHLIGFRLWV